MSRCFPFPPPGYERKTKADDTDLLKKEKHKEKKHKKEKKDKDKKEGKEKREKERSDEKHREKKDKKDKHRDKKKDKEKDRDKEKHKSDPVVSEKKVVGSFDSHVHKPAEKSKDRENDRNTTLAERTSGGRSAGHNGMSASENNHQISETKSFKYAPELGRKSMDEERRTSNQLPDKIVGAERINDGGSVKLAAKSGGPLQDTKEKSKEKPPLDSRMEGRGVIDFARSSGNTLVSNSGVVQNRVGGVLKPLEKKVEQKVDVKEKVREKEGDDRKREKRKEKDKEKPVFKDKDRENEKKKGEIMKAKSEDKYIQLTGIKNGSENHMLKPSGKDGNSKDLGVVQGDKFHSITKDSNHHAATVNNNVKKRKELGLNGIYDERVTGPNKMARTTASPHPFSENGRSLEPCQNSSAIAPRTQQPPPDTQVEHSHSVPPDDSQKAPMKIKVNVKECKINGTVADPCTESSRETTKAERKSNTPVKPPHPDSKYLNQVLSVPKMDEWSEYVDQEWLFNSNSSSTREPEVKSSGDDEMPQVWSKALWLEPVDVYALPYVIPH